MCQGHQRFRALVVGAGLVTIIDVATNVVAIIVDAFGGRIASLTGALPSVVPGGDQLLRASFRQLIPFDNANPATHAAPRVVARHPAQTVLQQRPQCPVQKRQLCTHRPRPSPTHRLVQRRSQFASRQRVNNLHQTDQRTTKRSSLRTGVRRFLAACVSVASSRAMPLVVVVVASAADSTTCSRSVATNNAQASPITMQVNDAGSLCSTPHRRR